MIIYLVANVGGLIESFLEGDVKSIQYTTDKLFEDKYLWRLNVNGMPPVLATDVVRWDSESPGIVPVDEKDPHYQRISLVAELATFKKGDKVIFNIKDRAESILYPEEALDNLTKEAEYIKRTMDHNGMLATVDSLETYTKLGEKELEYYAITFEDGFEMAHLSGYYLEKCQEPSKEALIKDLTEFLRNHPYLADKDMVIQKDKNFPDLVQELVILNKNGDHEDLEISISPLS